MANRTGTPDSRGRPALAAVPGCGSGTAHRAQCRVPGAAGHARRRVGNACAAAAVARRAARPVGRACRPTRCAGWRRHHSRLFDAGLASAPRWLELRARGVHDQLDRGEPGVFRACCGALDHPAHAGLRLAPGAQPAARGMPGVRLDLSPVIESLAACSLAALEAAADRNADALRPRWATPVRLLARAADGRVSRRRQAPARVAARRNPAPCRGYPRGACSVNSSHAFFSSRPSPGSLDSWTTGACAIQSNSCGRSPPTQSDGEHDDQQKFSHRGMRRRGDVVFNGRQQRQSPGRHRCQECGEVGRWSAAGRQPRGAGARRGATHSAVRCHPRRDAQGTGAARQRRLRFHQRLWR